jgi:8-oxo-dGTP pyrophosphatase MutT (NUDIX family)
LARQSEQRLEIFLVRRHDNIAFMGGAHVFPGGRVDDHDDTDDPDAWCDGAAAAVTRLAERQPPEALAFHIAAVRELFEEAGVLLARHDPNQMVAIHADSQPRFDLYRRDLAAQKLTLRDVVARERLRLALDQLVPFAHWVTPDIETRRFDTYFFLARAPEAQDATHDGAETSNGIWIEPADAIERCLRGEIALPPPTWTTLRLLAQCRDVEGAWEWAEAQRLVRVQPRVIEHTDGSREIRLPGDAEYPAIAGFAPRETRFLLRDGRWIPLDLR